MSTFLPVAGAILPMLKSRDNHSNNHRQGKANWGQFDMLTPSDRTSLVGS